MIEELNKSLMQVTYRYLWVGTLCDAYPVDSLPFIIIN